MKIETLKRAVAKLAHIPCDTAKTVLRQLWEDDPYAFGVIHRLFAMVADEDVRVGTPADPTASGESNG